MKTRAMAWFLLWSMVCLQPLLAAPAPNTLEKIRRNKTLAVGYSEARIPFSYLDNGQITGYSHEITQAVAKAIQQHLRLAELKIEPHLISSQNRFGMVQNGIIDLECTSTTHNRQRQQEYSFSNTFFIASSRLMTRKDAGIRDFADLAGKTVVVQASSTSEGLLQKIKAEKKIKLKQIAAIERNTSPLMLLQSGQADAYMNEDVLLYGTILESWRPTEWTVTGTPQSKEAYACTMRKDDIAMKQIADQAIKQLMVSGQMEKLYKKWFLSPIPPQGRMLNIPLNDDMKTLFATPNDRAFD